jgi:pimeloyl-ACP methyl ester carboxylesterase
MAGGERLRFYELKKRAGESNVVLLIVLVCLIVFYFGASAFFAYYHVHAPRTSVGEITPEKYGLTYEEVVFIGCADAKLVGWYIPSQNGAVLILTHGHGSNRGQMLDCTAILARHGYGVLLYDMRGHGESEGALAIGERCEPNDVQCALIYLQGREDVDHERIGALGFSRGAEATIVASARTGALKAVVLDGAWPGPTLDVTPPLTIWERVFFPMIWMSNKLLAWYSRTSQRPHCVELIAEIAPSPVFIISGQGVETFYGRRLYAAAREPKALWNIPEAGHGEGLSKRPQEYEERVVTFFDNALLKDTKPDE